MHWHNADNYRAIIKHCNLEHPVLQQQTQKISFAECHEQSTGSTFNFYPVKPKTKHVHVLFCSATFRSLNNICQHLTNKPQEKQFGHLVMMNSSNRHYLGGDAPEVTALVLKSTCPGHPPILRKLLYSLFHIYGAIHVTCVNQSCIRCSICLTLNRDSNCTLFRNTIKCNLFYVTSKP